MGWSEILLICVCALFLVIIIAWLVVKKKSTDEEKDNKVSKYEVIDGVRYSKDEEVLKNDGSAKVTLNNGDIILERGKEYTVGEKGDLLAGKYTILLADENISSVNMRIGGIVREYKHFTSVVLTEGDIISAVSANVILR